MEPEKRPAVGRWRKWLIGCGLTACVLSVVVGTGGCSGPVEDGGSVIELDPVYFLLTRDDSGAIVESLSEREMFEKGLRLYLDGDFQEARDVFGAVVETTESDVTRGLALVSMASCELAMENPGTALGLLSQAEVYLADRPERVRLDLVRMEALSGSGDWEGARRVGQELLGKPLDDETLARVHLEIGRSYLMARNLFPAASHLQAAIDIIFDKLPLQSHYRNQVLAMALCRLGDIYAQMAGSIPLVLPLERMEADFEDRLALMGQAEAMYLTAVRVRDPYWSGRAGYQAAVQYEVLADGLLLAEMPSGLSTQEQVLYNKDLNARVVANLEESVSMHENNAKLIAKEGLSVEWAKKSEARAIDLKRRIGQLGQ